MSIDRKNNDGHYSCGKCEECIANGWPMNCRWATGKEQTRNSTKARMLTVNGRTMTLVEWCEATGLNRETIRRRIRRGWTVEEALTLPLVRA